MTLIITMIRAEGIWQSSDRLVTRETREGKIEVVEDSAPKQLHIKCFDSEDSPDMLIAFTGLAQLADGTPTLQWLRETLRGEVRGVVRTLEFLCERLTRDIGQSRVWRNPLLLSIGVMQGDKRFYAEIRNTQPPSHPRKGQVRKEFDFVLLKVEHPGVLIGGGGAAEVRPADIDALLAQTIIRPAKWQDHLGLLAALNRRVAERQKPGRKTVSPWCHASYVCVEDEGGHSRDFAKPGEPQPLATLNMIMAGIDVYEMGLPIAANWSARRRGEPKELDGAELEAFARRALQPRP